MWPPPKVYENRGQWAGIEAYRKAISGPMTVLGKTLGLPQAVVRYVEAKCLVAGVTTSQGVALYSNNGIQKFYRGNIRNVEDTRKVELEDASTKIADVEATNAADFLSGSRRGHRLILHLAEGLGDTDRAQSISPRCTWPTADGRSRRRSLRSTPTGFEAEDFDVLHDHGVGIVWSPLSNLLLYGGTTDVAAARTRRRAGRPRVGLVAERQPQPPGRAEGRPDRQPDAVARPVHGPRPRRDGDPEPGEDPGLGERARVTRADGHFADLLVVAGTDGDPYDHLLTAIERDISLVVVGGVARFGRATLMAALDARRRFRVGHDRWVGPAAQLRRGRCRPARRCADAGTARAALRRALTQLPSSRSCSRTRRPGPRSPHSATRRRSGSSSSITTSRPERRSGRTCRVRTANQTGTRRDVASASPRSRCRSCSSKMELDPLTVSDEPGYWSRLAAQKNIPKPIRDAMAALD